MQGLVGHHSNGGASIQALAVLPVRGFPSVKCVGDAGSGCGTDSQDLIWEICACPMARSPVGAIFEFSDLSHRLEEKISQVFRPVIDRPLAGHS